MSSDINWELSWLLGRSRASCGNGVEVASGFPCSVSDGLNLAWFWEKVLLDISPWYWCSTSPRTASVDCSDSESSSLRTSDNPSSSMWWLLSTVFESSWSALVSPAPGVEVMEVAL